MDYDAIHLDIPPAWERLTFSAMRGVLLIVGASDTGKSTFARYLYRRLCAHHERVAFIDGDIGQAALGPPTTMTLALGLPGDDAFPPAGPRFRAFVGSVSPARHLLQTVVAALRLVRKAHKEGAKAIVFDTTGLIDPAYGGGDLKRAKVDLLLPNVVFGLQRESELEYLLLPLRRSRRVRVIDLPVSRAVQPREMLDRQQYRAESFRRYFEGSGQLEVGWQRMAVFPTPAFIPQRLVALEDKEGFALGLGVVLAGETTQGGISLHTPLASLEGVNAIHVGNLTLDPHTFRDSKL